MCCAAFVLCKFRRQPKPEKRYRFGKEDGNKLATSAAF